MDNIDRQINYECARIDALIDELEKLAIKNGTSLEEEIDKYVKDKIDTLTSRVTESMPKSKNQTQESPTVVGNYIFDKEDIIIRKGRKDGKYRSSLYSAAVISYKKESVYIHQCTFSLVSDVTSENVYDIPFSEKKTLGNILFGPGRSL